MFDFLLAAQFIVSIAFPTALGQANFFSFQKWWLNTISILSYKKMQNIEADLTYNSLMCTW